MAPKTDLNPAGGAANVRQDLLISDSHMPLWDAFGNFGIIKRVGNSYLVGN